MRRSILITIFVAISLATFAQQTIALLEPRVGDGSTAITGMEKNMVRGELRKAIVNLSGFEAITRNDIDQMMQEQNFQRTGMVSSAQIKRLGELSGADYICVSTLTKSDTEFYLEAYLIHLESGRMSNPASQYGELTNGKLANLFPACQALAGELLNEKSTYKSSYRPSKQTYGSKQDFTENAWDLDMKMVWVEGGEFMMGCTSEQGGNCEYNEQNVRRTTVDGFYIGMIEVTQSQWEKVMGTTIYQLWDKWDYQEHSRWNLLRYYEPFKWPPSRGVGSDYPVYCVTWEEAMAFCSQLSTKTGKTYTLPTEAQWEYAARGGNKPDGTKYAGSNVIDVVAWYEDNSNHGTHPCGTKRPNSLGLYDMSGNVGEWCKDWYEDIYRNSDSNNPTGASSGNLRVNRGGGWGIYAANCRVTHRDADDPYMRHRNLGFRVVCIP